eukprot:CFRG5224T1
MAATSCVFIRFQNNVVNLRVPSTGTVGDLHRATCEKFGTSCAHFNFKVGVFFDQTELEYKGKVLHEHMKLADLELLNNSPSGPRSSIPTELAGPDESTAVPVESVKNGKNGPLLGKAFDIVVDESTERHSPRLSSRHRTHKSKSPPVVQLRFTLECRRAKREVDKLDIKSLEEGKIHRMMINLTTNAMGMPVQVPVFVAKGKNPGPCLGIVAAIHGNEINGIPVIHRLFKEIDIDTLNGTLVAVVVANVLGYSQGSREYSGQDLNRIMPGGKAGRGNLYAKQLFQKVLQGGMDYCIDLHTASTGRVNSLYVRADMKNPITAKMAMLQNTQFLLHAVAAFDGRADTLRNSMMSIAVPTVTLEIGDPSVFNRALIREALPGIFNLMDHLSMLSDEGRADLLDDEITDNPMNQAVLCTKSVWMWTDHGGLLKVVAGLGDHVAKGQRIAYIEDIFGFHVCNYYAPTSGWIIGKSVYPVVQAGDRIAHIGVQGTLDAFGLTVSELEGLDLTSACEDEEDESERTDNLCC